MHIVDMKVYFDVQGMTVQFDNLFNGNEVLGKCHRVSNPVDVNKNTVRSTNLTFCFASSQAVVTVLTIHGNPTSFTGLPQHLLDIIARATSVVPHVVKSSRKRKKIINLCKATFRTPGVLRHSTAHRSG
jgi:hypothetical protein